MSKVTRTLNFKPFNAGGAMISFHTILYGLGFLLASGGFANTFIYGLVDSLVPARAYGAFVVAAGVAGTIAFLRSNVKWAVLTAQLQGLIFLFSTVAYVLNDRFMLAVSGSLTWVIILFYLAYIYNDEDLFQ